MYKQSLYRIVPNHIKSSVLKKKNKHKKWEYGYNEEHDMVVISKTGEVGEVYEIQNLKIALPLENDVVTFEGNKWMAQEYPKELKGIKTIFDWKNYKEDFKEEWYEFIDQELEGPTYIFPYKEFLNA